MLVPSFLPSLYLTLYKTDISLRRTERVDCIDQYSLKSTTFYYSFVGHKLIDAFCCSAQLKVVVVKWFYFSLFLDQICHDLYSTTKI